MPVGIRHKDLSTFQVKQKLAESDTVRPAAKNDSPAVWLSATRWENLSPPPTTLPPLTLWQGAPHQGAAGNGNRDCSPLHSSLAILFAQRKQLFQRHLPLAQTNTDHRHVFLVIDPHNPAGLAETLHLRRFMGLQASPELA